MKRYWIIRRWPFKIIKNSDKYMKNDASFFKYKRCNVIFLFISIAI